MNFTEVRQIGSSHSQDKGTCASQAWSSFFCRSHTTFPRGLSLNTVLSIPSAHPPFLNPASAELNTICFFPRTHLTMNLVCLIIFLPVLGPSQQVDYESWRVAEPTTPKSDCRRSGLATPSYLALVCWWLWAAGVWTVANEGRAFLWIPLTCLPPSDKLRHKWWYLLPILPSSISFTFIC